MKCGKNWPSGLGGGRMLTDKRMTDNVRWMPGHLPVRIAHMSTLCSSELQSDPGHTIFIIGI